MRKAHPDWSEKEVEEKAAMTFAHTFGINVQKAHDLEQAGKWASWKESHGFRGKCELSCFEIKTVDQGGDKYIDYIVASTGTDKACGLTDDGRVWIGDNLMPECVEDLNRQLVNSIGVINDPGEIKDIQEVQREMKNPTWTGVGHEHTLLDKNIIPVSTTIESKTIMKDGHMMIRARDVVNKYSRRASDFWGMVNDKILRFASIEFKPTKYDFREVNGVLQRFVQHGLLGGKTWTGRPAQGLCGVINVGMKCVMTDDDGYGEIKSILENSQKEVMKVSEEDAKRDADVKAKADADAKLAEDVKAVLEQNKKLLEHQGVLEAEIKALKDGKDDKNLEALEGKIQKELEEIKAQHKNVVAEQQKKDEEIKSRTDKAIEEIKAASSIDQKWKIAATQARAFESAGGDVESLLSDLSG